MSFLKQHYKSLKPFLFILTIIIIIFLILWIVGKLSNSTLGLFPFEVEVWGTASDYLGITVGCFSVLLLYKTLDAQLSATNIQNKQLSLLIADKRKDLKYLLEISFRKGDKEEYIVNIKNKGDYLRKFEIVYHNNPIIFDSIQKKFVNSKKRFKYTTELVNGNSEDIIFEKTPFEEQGVSLDFEDIYGLKYTKFLIIYPNSTYVNGPLRFID